MGIASFVQAKGCPWRRGGRGGGWYFCVFTDKQMAPVLGRPRVNGIRTEGDKGEAPSTCPAQWAGCSARVTARGRGGEGARAKIDAKHALVLHVVTFSVSLEPPARPTCCVCLDDSANRDICWEMKAWAKFECQYPRHGRRGGANKRRSVCHRAVFILQMKGYRATCVPERNDHF